MAYISGNPNWWLADIIVEFTIQGESDKVVHFNLTLIKADSAIQAYDKAIEFGKRHESAYTNTDGQSVTARFRGLRDLLVIYDELEDGSEILHEEQTNLREEQILAAMKSKDRLSVFSR